MTPTTPDTTADTVPATETTVPAGPVTQPMPPAVETARRILTAVLESGPGLEDTLTVTEALDRLLDVHPPYPPLGLWDDAVEPDTGIPSALAALDVAAAQATSVRELGRYTCVALLLQQVRPAVVDPDDDVTTRLDVVADQPSTGDVPAQPAGRPGGSAS